MGQPAEVTPHTHHTGDDEGDVATLGGQCKFAIRDSVFHACNAVHGLRYASNASESPVETWHPQAQIPV